MDIFSCASQYCLSKVMLKVTKNMRNYLKAKLKKKKSFNSSLESVQYLYVANCRR